MEPEERKRLLDRLARVEGQVRGLRSMLEADRCCEDVLTQLLATRSGLEQAGLLILDDHLESCVLSDAKLTPEALTQLRETLRLWTRHSVTA